MLGFLLYCSSIADEVGHGRLRAFTEELECRLRVYVLRRNAPCSHHRPGIVYWYMVMFGVLGVRVNSRRHVGNRHTKFHPPSWRSLGGVMILGRSVYPGSLAWDVDISLVRRVFLVKSVPTSAHTQLNSVFPYFGVHFKKSCLFFHF